ncbi:MAG: NADP-dependent oxidoreductase [Candidatus Hodarchaeales archaeon]|jgi:NADPH-dependent curcumin reductase CurA
MSESQNIQVKLAKRPIGEPKQTDWLIEKTEIPKINENEILVKVHYISVDPAMRGWMNDVKSYLPPVKLGEVMRAGGLGEVVRSNLDNFKVGDFVTGGFGVQSYCVSDGKGLTIVDRSLADLPKWLGVLGMTGMTSYFGLLEIGKPKSGDVVLISGAAGAVGSIVGQIAKIKGCYVVGIAGTSQKCDYIVNDLGFDKAINYKTDNVNEKLKEYCPNGINIYFDNVGGELLDLVLRRISRGARIVICGAISQYNRTKEQFGPKNYMSLLINRAKMEGFLVFDFRKRYSEAYEDISKWLKEGKLKSEEDIALGIENFNEILLKLFSGENTGKLMIKVVN